MVFMCLPKPDHRGDVNNCGSWFGSIINGGQTDKYGIKENTELESLIHLSLFILPSPLPYM